LNSPETIIIIRYFNYLESKGKTFNILFGVVWTAIFGVLDILAPAEASFSFLYLLPIGFVTWFGGKKAGIIISMVCATLLSIHYFVDISIISIWNILSTFAVFSIFSVMLTINHKMWLNERTLSQEDPLTGVMNIRAFYKRVEYEILLLKRKGLPFSIAYLDLDNFKTVNDRYGHKRGDELLKSLAINTVENLRKTDVVARIGGDEFAIFLPATDHDAVKVVMEKARERLHALKESEQWETTFSIGVLTCTHGESELEELISLADSLMYEVKNNGKNNIRYATQDDINEEQYPLLLT
jgi:diguanylate cyclase (GGDEF)-like protein